MDSRPRRGYEPERARRQAGRYIFVSMYCCINEHPLLVDPVFVPVMVEPESVAELCVQVTVTLAPATLTVHV